MTAQTKKLPPFKKLILGDLKEANENEIIKKIKSIRYSSFSMGDAVDVESVNLTKTERDTLESILNEYQSGSFNSMEDIYEYRKDSTKLRTAKYVCLRNEFSQDVKDKVKKDLADNFEVIDYASAWKFLGCDYETAVYRKLIQLEKI